MGELLQPRTGQPGLQGRGPARDPAAATVVQAETQGAIERLRALLRRMAAGDLRPDVPWDDAPRPSEGEGRIPAESRMREIRTSGSTSGGVETDRMGAGLSTKRKRGQEAPDPTRHRATPRLYSGLVRRIGYRLVPSGNCTSDPSRTSVPSATSWSSTCRKRFLIFGPARLNAKRRVASVTASSASMP